jgi:hypothetical protein
VRARVDLPPVALGSQDAMRSAVEHEDLMELGWELQRWPYLVRHGMLPRTEAEKSQFVVHDPDFKGFDINTYGATLPIPLVEVNYNPNIQQNPGY